jgi:hypothetical protein
MKKKKKKQIKAKRRNWVAEMAIYTTRAKVFLDRKKEESKNKCRLFRRK